MGTLYDILMLWILARDDQLWKWSETVNIETNHYILLEFIVMFVSFYVVQYFVRTL